MAHEEKFDLAVIGAGPGGYVAAIKAAQMGAKVALIEKNYLGGTCLNVGCIPTKTLLANAAVLHKIKKAKSYGIETGPVSIHYDQMKSRKDGVIEGIRKSLGGLLKANQINIFSGNAEFLSPRQLKVKGENSLILDADKIIIATGSEPLDIPAFPCDHKQILNSTSILELTKLPKSLAVIGGGYIGCEFASLFAELGVKVTILEALPSIVAMQGSDISSALTKAFEKAGIEIRCNVFVEGIETHANGVKVKLKGGESVESDLALVSVGRKFMTEGLNPDKAGLPLTEKGAIAVNDKMETSVPGIYAIGDITGIAMLAHVASHQGLIAAANALGQEAKMHYDAVPAVIFTHPEIATVGLTREQATEKGYDISVGTFPFQALGKAQAAMETNGFTQVISNKKTGQILGAHVVGEEAASLISEMALAINNELTLECVIETIHAHPTLPEAWLEAALLAKETPIHFPPKRKK